MELRQLEYFVTVVEEANFTRAAERLHVAQPGVSAQVKRLERELGQELLDRSGRTVCLTDAGRAVLPHAYAALASVQSTRDAVDALNGLVRGSVSVGMVTACASADLTDLLSRLHNKHPGLDISLAEDDSRSLLAGVLDGTFDIAVIGVAGELPEGLESRVITDERLVAGVAADHPLAEVSSLPFAELATQSVICLPEGTGIRTCLDFACAAAGTKPTVALEASNLGIIVSLAAQGLGMAVLPESTVGELHRIDLEPEARSRLELVWRSSGGKNPAASALIDLAGAVPAE
ncbi:LysR family transcriptional regulator [Rhodococcus erythropolis]|jgi:DNA-binding transcriptional LysR family regulator|uniref:LysR family transcriptional regulator n=1 Tax=Rhodococcus erythropolis TaxID=1833 RepID=A0A5P3G5Q7_RHOER|nr:MULTISPECIES: LysR family transcriptional regulator [Rhodococcus]MCJ0947574.1 LysR family transcriptional regulator [Rhodococcus sp. ARC_M8]MDJ0106525.1 LysR family transcriptional regulator [Rhodococcus erythropolis]QEX10069.1 LysR family transcriptional regulator [Rhodococcus erythropolis]QIP39012.1 LysR family transcriptional regulator [Rhodococcus erythropolis]UKO88133.1 LysR family transcriptional regulator [Rhodococcus erythropolis]